MVIQKPPRLIPNGMNDSGGNRARYQVKEADGDGRLKSRVIKRSLLVGGHKTSVSLEDVFWNELRSMANECHVHLSQLVGKIDAEREHHNLSSAIRMFVFDYRRNYAQAARRQDKPVSEIVGKHRSSRG